MLVKSILFIWSQTTLDWHEEKQNFRVGNGRILLVFYSFLILFASQRSGVRDRDTPWWVPKWTWRLHPKNLIAHLWTHRPRPPARPSSSVGVTVWPRRLVHSPTPPPPPPQLSSCQVSTGWRVTMQQKIPCYSVLLFFIPHSKWAFPLKIYGK